MSLRRLAFVFAALPLIACTADEPALVPGATSFVTEEPEYNSSSDPGPGGASDMGLAASADGGGTPGAPMGRTGTVEEGDIFRFDHNRLFYFNTYRGLVIYDLADTTHPMQISRVPVYGYPVEMYVDGDRVYALLRDSLYLTEDTDGRKFEEHRTSQLVTIDISDVTKPMVLKTIDILGELREGLSRKIDDTIYVTTYISQYYYSPWWSDWSWYGAIDPSKEQAWVYSFNVADPADPALVGKLQLFEGQSGNGAQVGPDGVQKWFEGVAISATSNTLEIAENWEVYASSPDAPNGCGYYSSYERTTVSLVDISDPSGQIRLYTKFDSYGKLGDQFKQMYVYDDATKKAYYYGIFANRYWDWSGCFGGSGTQNSFQTWDVTDGAHPTRVGSLRIGEPGDTVSATIFDTSRQVAFAVTSRQIDPLYAIGYADPVNPKVLSQIDGLTGTIDVFTFVGGTQYLMGIGVDNSDACSGFASGSTSWHTGVSVSILDVKDLTATRLVQRGCLDVKDAEWVSSPANWNLDQGHKMIGLGSDGRANVLTVPVNYWKRTDDQYWYWYDSGSTVGMMSFDLTKDDPSKPATQQTVLTNHGSFDHSHGSVRRTIVFDHDETAGPRRMVLNLSDTYLSLFDIEDLDHPTKTADLEIAPDVQALYKFGDYMVEHVRDEPTSYASGDLRSEFRVKPMGGALDETKPVATFTVGQVQRVVRWKDSLVIFRNNGPWNGATPPTTQMVVFDLSTPSAPRLRSLTDLGISTSYGYYGWWCGWEGYWGGWWWSSASDWIAVDTGVAFAVTEWGDDYYYDHQTKKLVYADLSNLDAPTVHTHVLPDDASKVSGITPDASDTSGFFVTVKDKVGEKPGNGDWHIGLFKYYAQRWNVVDGDINAGDSTNLPGQLVRTWKSGDRTFLLSQDDAYAWNQEDGSDYGYYHSDPRLHLLERTSSSMGTLRDSTTFQNRYLGGLTAAGDRLYLTTSYAGWYSQEPNIDTSDHLTIFDLGQAKLDRGFDGSLGLSYFSVMGADANRLFVRLTDSGVLVLDATDAKAPHGDRFLRTLGWGANIELANDTMYVAAGQFGVFQRALGTPSLMP